MLTNRSAPSCAVTPVLAYPDVAAAVAWLEQAFGFRVRLRIGNHRAQMWFGSECLIVREDVNDNESAMGSSVMLRVEDVDALCEQAVKHGANLLHAPQNHVYGERQATVKDFAGHIWTLTETIEDIDPAVWGGEAEEL